MQFVIKLKALLSEHEKEKAEIIPDVPLVLLEVVGKVVMVVVVL